MQCCDAMLDVDFELDHERHDRPVQYFSLSLVHDKVVGAGAQMIHGTKMEDMHRP